MRDLGTPGDRFRRAVNARSLPIAEAAMREMGASAGLGEALELVGLMAKSRDPRYDRAAARWVARLASQHDLATDQARTLLAMVALLPHTPELLTALRAHLHELQAPS